LAARIQGSSAVFLRLTQDRIDRELASLRRRNLIEDGPADRCANCDQSFQLSATGHRYLASRLEEWQLSQLANSAMNT